MSANIGEIFCGNKFRLLYSVILIILLILIIVFSESINQNSTNMGLVIFFGGAFIIGSTIAVGPWMDKMNHCQTLHNALKSDKDHINYNVHHYATSM